MKRPTKIIGISLLSFLGLIFIVLAIASWYLFTPSKLTSLLRSQLKDYLICETTLDKAEITFFSTFPNIGVRVDNLCLKEKNKGDTIAFARSISTELDLKTWWNTNNIKLNHFTLIDGYAHYKVDTLGNNSFTELLAKETVDEKTKPENQNKSTEFILLNITIDNFTARYTDLKEKGHALLEHFNAESNALFSAREQYANLHFNYERFFYKKTDKSSFFFETKNDDCHIKINKAEASPITSFFLKTKMPHTSMRVANEYYLKDANLNATLPINFSLKDLKISFKENKLQWNDLFLTWQGNLKLTKKGDSYFDLQYATNTWDVKQIVNLIPKSHQSSLKDVSRIEGKIQCNGIIKGTYGKKKIPSIATNIHYKNGILKMTNSPLVHAIKANTSIHLNMNKGERSTVKIHNATATLKKSQVSLSGTIHDLLKKISCNLQLKGDVQLKDIQSFIPKELPLILKGAVKGNMKLNIGHSFFTHDSYHSIYAKGNFNTKKIDISYEDSIKCLIPEGQIGIKLSPHSKAQKDTPLATLIVKAKQLKTTLSTNTNALLDSVSFKIKVNDLGSKTPNIWCNYNISNFWAEKDTLNISIKNPKGTFSYIPVGKQMDKPAIQVKLKGDSLFIKNRETQLASVNKLDLSTQMTAQETNENNFFSMWNPSFDMNLQGGWMQINEKYDLNIPHIDFTMIPEEMRIRKGKLLVGDSDFNLQGTISNIKNYANKKGLLKGNLQLTSEYTDINQIMDLIDGFGAKEDSTKLVQEKTDTLHTKDDDPFMVPLGVDIHLDTSIDEATTEKGDFNAIKGGVTIKDGELIIEQMGFTSKAANMQLTALYRSKRRNHLFTGLDFHLLNIDVAELIKLIPDVDKMVPMLKSFEGKGEFHLAAEAYLKSNYALKLSTLRAAAAIEGQDLILMDSPTFSKMARMLHFKKGTKNKVDSISVEMTVLRDEVDLYPFLIVMDKYKAVIAGRHYLDNTFDYHVSLTDCPLPIRLGLNIKGTMDDMHFKLARCKYKHLFRPDKQGAVEKRTLALKRLISKSLKENVKKQTILK